MNQSMGHSKEAWWLHVSHGHEFVVTALVQQWALASQQDLSSFISVIRHFSQFLTPIIPMPLSSSCTQSNMLLSLSLPPNRPIYTVYYYAGLIIWTYPYLPVYLQRFDLLCNILSKLHSISSFVEPYINFLLFSSQFF